MSNDSRGEALLAEAIKVRDGWSLFGSKKTRARDAGELFVKASNSFKIDRNWLKAGDALVKAAECFMNAGDINDCSRSYNDAATCFKKVNIEEAINCLKKCIQLYLESGRFGVAAKAEKEIGEIYEEEGDYENAIIHFQNSAEYYESDGSQSTSNSVLLKVAHLSALVKDFSRAADIFEKVAKDSVNNKLTKYSTRGYLLNAGLCKLALGDVVDAKKSLDYYTTLSFEFNQSREMKFLNTLIESVDDCDLDKFNNTVQDYNSISQFDHWHTKLLLAIKDSIKDEEDLA